MSPAYQAVARVACDLLNADPYRRLEDVVENHEFRYEQLKIWGAIRIASVSRLSEVLKKYCQVTGRSVMPRRRDPPLR
jgi:hypothetical protein